MWSIFVISLMMASLSSGTLSQTLNAWMSLERMSLPGTCVMYRYGSMSTASSAALSASHGTGDAIGVEREREREEKVAGKKAVGPVHCGLPREKGKEAALEWR